MYKKIVSLLFVLMVTMWTVSGFPAGKTDVMSTTDSKYGYFYSNSAVSNQLNFRKSRGTEISPVIVNNADNAGAVEFQGWDGSTFVPLARILASVDGTPGTNDMPGVLRFSTSLDGTNSPVTRLTIDNTGLSTFAYAVAISEQGASPEYVTKFIGGDQAADITYTLPVNDGSASQVLITDGSGVLSWSSVGNAASYTTSFANGDLAAGILTVTHNLGSKYCVVAVYNNSDKVILPDDITGTDTNTTTIDLSSYGVITGTWNLRIIK